MSQRLKKAFLFVTVIRNPRSVKSLHGDAVLSKILGQTRSTTMILSSSVFIIVFPSSGSICFPSYFSLISLYSGALGSDLQRSVSYLLGKLIVLSDIPSGLSDVFNGRNKNTGSAAFPKCSIVSSCTSF